MSLVELEIQNGGSVLNRLQRLSQIQKEDLVVVTVHNVLDNIYDRMSQSTPFRTGYLKDSEKKRYSSTVSEITVMAYYGIFVDEGHKVRGGKGYVKANPFFSSNVVSGSLEVSEAIKQLFSVK